MIPFIREIPHGHVIDGDKCRSIIDAKFQVLEHLDSFLVYGGAVRDTLAGLPIGGDLDLVVPSRLDAAKTQTALIKSGYVVVERKNGYGHFMDHCIVRVITAVNEEQCKVQIIEMGSWPMVIALIRTSDLVCCGVFLTKDRNAMEAIPNAASDCRKRTLQLNTFYGKNSTNKKNLFERVDKLEKRGWHRSPELTRLMSKINKHAQ